jgi:heterodisulfide reductase subunit A-like polyferredoxin
VDLANEGEYLAGLAHSPRFIDETIAHAKAVAGRAATILSRAKLDIAGQVAKVDPEGRKYSSCMSTTALAGRAAAISSWPVCVFGASALPRNDADSSSMVRLIGTSPTPVFVL